MTARRDPISARPATPGDAGRLGARVEDRLATIPTWVLPVAIFLVALGVRAWTLLDERAGNPLFRSAILDDAVYLRLADEIRTGASAGKSWFLAPLYPWVLAVAARTAAPDMALAEWLSVFVGAATAAMAAVAARTIHSSTAGWLAGLLCAASGILVFHDVLPGQEPLLCILHVTALLLIALYLRDGGAWWIALLVGVVGGVAMLGRATSGVLIVAFAAVAVLRVNPRRRAWSGVGLALIGTALVLVPAAVRNLGAVGDFTPFPWSGGPNFYLANGPESRPNVDYSSRELVMDPEAMERRAAEIAEKAEGRRLRPSEVSSYWMSRTWRESGGAGEMSGHLGRKALLYWNRIESGNNHDVEVEREWSVWLRLVPVTSWWLLAFGVAGWWVARRRAPALDAAILMVVLTWASLTVFYPLSRYKLPVVPIAAVAAASGAAELLLWGTSLVRGAVAALVVLVSIQVSRLHIRDSEHGWTWRSVALAFEREGDRGNAIATVGRLLADEPDDGRLLDMMGRLLVEDGRPAEALPFLRRAQGDSRTSGTAAVRTVTALVLMGNADRAEQEGRGLLDEEMPKPLRAELLASMALAALARGDRSTAVERLRAAEAIDAQLPSVKRARKAFGE